MDHELGPVRAPELDGAVGWLNTPAPITLAQLRGTIALLDVWTAGCITCQHVLPDLQRLQATFAAVLVVIGIHAAKFDNERSTENIRRTLQRLGIRHPVANDAQFAIWQAYTVRAWPTQVLIDPRGYVVGTATTSFTFKDFGIPQPRVPVVLSVADTIRLEYDFRFVPDTTH